MRAYQNFLTIDLRNAIKPICWTVAIILSVWFTFGKVFPAIGSVFTIEPLNQQFAAACTLLDGTVEKVDGNRFCVKVTVHETIVPPDIDGYKLQCIEGGGVPERRDFLSACYIYNIIEELGSRDAYTGSK